MIMILIMHLLWSISRLELRTGLGSELRTGLGSELRTGLGSGLRTGLGSELRTGLGSGLRTELGSEFITEYAFWNQLRINKNKYKNQCYTNTKKRHLDFARTATRHSNTTIWVISLFINVLFFFIVFTT